MAAAKKRKKSKKRPHPSDAVLKTFNGWMKHLQSINPASLSPGERAKWRATFKELRAQSAAMPPLGILDLRRPGDRLYSVAIRDGKNLWLALFVRRSKRGEIYVVRPQIDPDWNPHSSYHRNGKFHLKSYGRESFPKFLQKPDQNFKGVVSMGIEAGFGKSLPGAVCDPAIFDGVVEVPGGILGPRWGAISVDVVQPGRQPPPTGRKTYKRRYFRDLIPHLVITVLR
jgi:hypothetical protein